MGKGSLRRVEDLAAVQARWPWSDPVEPRTCTCGKPMEFVEGLWPKHGAYVCGCGREVNENER